MTKVPNPEWLYGRWYPVDDEPSDRFILQRASQLSMGWGQQYEFAADGTFGNIYSARCGNDPRIHHWVGTWEWIVVGRSILLKPGAPTPDPKFDAPLPPPPRKRTCQVETLTQDALVLVFAPTAGLALGELA
ncbi:MAG: hypothetical protein AAFO87_03395 [Cyanobacteria bacterium J06607_6]